MEMRTLSFPLMEAQNSSRPVTRWEIRKPLWRMVTLGGATWIIKPN